MSRNLRQLLTHLFILFLVWAATHMFTVSWGLPNLASFAANPVPLRPHFSGTRMMSADAYKYPPLQYLIWNCLVPPNEAEPMSIDEELTMYSSRLRGFRLVVAAMSFGTALVLYAISVSLLDLKNWSLLPPLIFIFNPMGLYFSHTTNMDQPYLFWFSLSCLVFLWTNLVARDYWPTIAGNALFGILTGCAFCTKDQVYALYVLPLILYAGQLAFRERKVKDAALLSAIWALSFTLAVVVIYRLAGGWSTFRLHIEWITGKGSSSWVQYPGTLAGRLHILLKSAGDLCRALDFSLVAAGTFALAVCIQRRADKRLLYTLLSLLILFLSFHVFFAQATKFTFPRFFLPFVPVCALIAGSLVVAIEKRFMKWFVATAVAVSSACAGTECLSRMMNDTRMTLRKTIPSISTRPPEEVLVAVDGSTWGKKYPVRGGVRYELKAIRDWSLHEYGWLWPKQKSVLMDRLYLALVSPDILVLSENVPDKTNILKACGFDLVRRVAPSQPVIPSLFTYESPSFYIHVRTASGLTLSRDDIALGFDEQLLILQDCLGNDNAGRVLPLFGHLCSDFVGPDVRSCSLHPGTIVAAALAYDCNGRIDSARKAFAFLTRYSRDPGHHEMARKFFERNKS